MYHMLKRRAFTLVEIIVALTVLGIMGVMFTQILMSQGRFTDQQNALRGARMVSRQAMNILESEIRMVQDSGGIDSAATDGKAIRLLVPYRFGINCGVAGGKTVVSLLPVDSLALAQALYAGFAWRSSTGLYNTVLPAAPTGADKPVTSANPAQCTGSGATQANIKTLTLSGRTGKVLDLSPVQVNAPRGQAMFMFQRITYSFKKSTAYPKQNGLYRTVQGGTAEELMAPFDTSARFKYWTRGATASVSAPPSLALIRGVDAVFAARSSYTPLGRTSAPMSTVVSSIFFRNVHIF
jgi:prepilin-type N-terminal cleavage/methylation domain-containing protein